MLQWIITNSENFKTMEKLDDILYFLEDTREIYKGDKVYNQSVIFITDLPKFAIKNKIYINTLTMEAKIWTGTDWKTLIPTIKTILQDGVQSNGLVTGNAIKSYVSRKFEDFEKNFNAPSRDDITSIDSLNTDNIVLSKDIHVNHSIGNYNPGDVIPSGTTLTEILLNHLVKREELKYIRPVLTIRPDSQMLECGEILSSLITANFEKNDAGELSKYYLDKILNGSITTVVTNSKIVEYQEEPYSISDTDDLKYRATVEFKEGPIKKDNLGNPSPKNHILSGKITSELTITGKRKLFFGTVVEKIEEENINSDIIRGLRSILNPQNGVQFNLPIKKGDKQIIIAYPDSLKGLSSVHSNVLGQNVIDAFKLIRVKVEGANKFKPILYKVYVYSPTIPYQNDDEYIITI